MQAAYPRYLYTEMVLGHAHLCGCKMVYLLYESMNLINKRVSFIIKSENFTLD